MNKSHRKQASEKPKARKHLPKPKQLKNTDSLSKLQGGKSASPLPSDPCQTVFGC